MPRSRRTSRPPSAAPRPPVASPPRGAAGLLLAAASVALAATLAAPLLLAPRTPAPGEPRAASGGSADASLPSPEETVPDTYAALAAEARRLGSHVVAAHRGSPRATSLHAAILSESGAHAEAATAWKSHLDRHPDTAEGWYRLGLIAVREGADEAAAGFLTRAAGLDASLPDVQGHLGRVLLKLDRVDDAAAVLEPVVGDDRGGAVRLFHLAHARLRQGRDAEALEAFREAVRRAPSYTGAWYGIATAAARVGADDEAAEAREEFRRLKARDAEKAAANLDRDESERLRILLARWYATAGTIAIAAGDAAGAERAWRRGMAVAPHVPDNVRALAEFYRRQGRTADAARIAADVPLPPERRGP